MEQALAQAREGRLHILGIMNQTITQGRTDISQYAPHLYTIQVPTDLIGAVIGPGGKTIRHIIAESKCEIDIDDSGKVTIAAISKQSAEIAREIIENITQVPEIGKIYDGVVKGIKDFGAFVEIFPGKEGLLHISEIDNKRVAKVSDVLKVGEKIQVKLLAIDEFGKLKLSRRILLKPEPRKEYVPRQNPEKDK
jgi:polyribonucleotide nucleotidyltransferase